MTCKLGFTVAIMVGLAFSAPSQAADEVVLGLSFGKTGLYSTINKTNSVIKETKKGYDNLNGNS